MSLNEPMRLEFDEDPPAEQPAEQLEQPAEQPTAERPAVAEPPVGDDAAGAVEGDPVDAVVMSEPTEHAESESAPAAAPAEAEGAPAGDTAADSELDRAIADLGEAPGAAVAPAAPDEVIAAVDDGRNESVSSWPFGVYVGAWVAFAAFILWRFFEVPADTALYEVDIYRWVVVAGVALTVLGPLLSVAVWAMALRRPDARSGALFVSALVKGALATFAGVSIWWASLLVLDQVRIGSLL